MLLIFGESDGLGARAMNGDGPRSRDRPSRPAAIRPPATPALSLRLRRRRSFGESTSTARSGANGTCFSGFVISASRSARTKATSGPRTVSGSRSMMNPVSAA